MKGVSHWLGNASRAGEMRCALGWRVAAALRKRDRAFLEAALFPGGAQHGSALIANWRQTIHLAKQVCAGAPHPEHGEA